MARLEQKKRLYSPHSVASVRTIFEEHTCVIDSFRMISKLSGGGVVVRTLEAPKSDALFYGMISDTIEIAELRYDSNITPYQPILKILLCEENGGCMLDIHFSLPKEYLDIGILYNIAGILIALSSIPLFRAGHPLTWVAILFGVIMFWYPILRSRISFADACSSALRKIQTLPLDGEEK